MGIDRVRLGGGQGSLRRRSGRNDQQHLDGVVWRLRALSTMVPVADAFVALALLVEATAMGRLMGNVYLSVARLAIPMRLFDDEAQALAWLDRHSSSDTK